AEPKDLKDPKSWILRIVMHRSFNLILNRKQHAKRKERIAMEPKRAAAMAAPPIEEEELLTTLRSHIDQLPELDRQLLACSYVASMTHQQIADLVGIPRSTVSFKIQDSLKRLNNSLTKAGFAAMVPLAGAENMFEALTTGSHCPPGMTERMLS